MWLGKMVWLLSCPEQVKSHPWELLLWGQPCSQEAASTEWSWCEERRAWPGRPWMQQGLHWMLNCLDPILSSSNPDPCGPFSPGSMLSVSRPGPGKSEGTTEISCSWKLTSLPFISLPLPPVPRSDMSLVDHIAPSFGPKCGLLKVL